MSATLLVRDLHKRYDDLPAVRGVSLEVGDGEIFGLIGPNGAGKTTTLECILGLREPDAGTVEVCGLDALRHPGRVKQLIGAALQATALQDQITPREALALFGSFYADPVEPDPLLERFSLAAKAHAPYQSLSGGQRQRLALALAFVNRPRLVLLDEPTAGLDPQARRELHGEIQRIREEGCSVLLTTHHIEEAERLCDRIAIMDHGRILGTGTPSELIARSASMPLVSLVTSRPLAAAALADLPGAEGLAQQGSSVRFRTAIPTRTLAALMRLLEDAGVEPVELQVRRASLEDVLLELTGAGPRGG